MKFTRNSKEKKNNLQAVREGITCEDEKTRGGYNDRYSSRR